jgi:class 3 adenylate cyclase
VTAALLLCISPLDPLSLTLSLSPSADTIGDAFVVVGGLPGYKSQENHAMACLQFAFHMQNDMKIIRAACEVDIELRIGIHTGSVIGSVISLNKPRYLVWGSDTLVANAMESTGVPGAIQVSQ